MFWIWDETAALVRVPQLCNNSLHNYALSHFWHFHQYFNLSVDSWSECTYDHFFHLPLLQRPAIRHTATNLGRHYVPTGPSRSNPPGLKPESHPLPSQGKAEREPLWVSPLIRGSEMWQICPLNNHRINNMWNWCIQPTVTQKKNAL